MGDLQTTENSKTDPKNILNFIDFMNKQDKVCKEYGTFKWAGDLPTEQIGAPTACYLDFENNTNKLTQHHKQGCELTNALNNKKDENENPKKIIEAVTDILSSKESGIRANFNRLLSLVTNYKNQNPKPDWYTEVVDTLKNSSDLKTTVIDGIKSEKMGFVRKSDYLYFYKEMGWSDTNTDTKLAESFLTQLKTAFTTRTPADSPNNFELETAHHTSIMNSITQNQLQDWLCTHNTGQFIELKKMFENSEWTEKQALFKDTWKNCPVSKQ